MSAHSGRPQMGGLHLSISLSIYRSIYPSIHLSTSGPHNVLLRNVVAPSVPAQRKCVSTGGHAAPEMSMSSQALHSLRFLGVPGPTDVLMHLPAVDGTMESLYRAYIRLFTGPPPARGWRETACQEHWCQMSVVGRRHILHVSASVHGTVGTGRTDAGHGGKHHVSPRRPGCNSGVLQITSGTRAITSDSWEASGHLVGSVRTDTTSLDGPCGVTDREHELEE